MSEKFHSVHEDTILRIDVRNDGVEDGPAEDRIKLQARDYALGQRDSLSRTEFRELVNRIDTLLKRQDIERLNLTEKLEQAKQEVRERTIQVKSMVQPLSLSDIRSPAGLSHYIDQSGDETMKILEEQMGLDSTWKLIALTGMHTSIELGKGLADILKLWEGTAEGNLALDDDDLSALEKTLAITKWVGLDGLRALALGWSGLALIGKILSKIKLPENLFEPVPNNGGLGRSTSHGQEVMGNIPKVSDHPLPFDISKNEVYQHHPYLQDYAEFFGELKSSDIMGSGNNAIVLRHPKIEWQVVKIPYPWEVDSVTQEIQNHTKAYLALKEGIRNGQISEDMAIPKLRKDFPESQWVFVMQQVEGQSLHTKMLLELPEYKTVAEKLARTRDISTMTDNEVYRYIADNHPFGAEYLDMLIKWPRSAEYTQTYIDAHPEIRNTMEYLESQGIGHADIHGGNIMIGNDGKTYIIDFGRVSSFTR